MPGARLPVRVDAVSGTVGKKGDVVALPRCSWTWRVDGCRGGDRPGCGVELGYRPCSHRRRAVREQPLRWPCPSRIAWALGCHGTGRRPGIFDEVPFRGSSMALFGVDQWQFVVPGPQLGHLAFDTGGFWPRLCFGRAWAARGQVGRGPRPSPDGSRLVPASVRREPNGLLRSRLPVRRPVTRVPAGRDRRSMDKPSSPAAEQTLLRSRLWASPARSQRRSEDPP